MNANAMFTLALMTAAVMSCVTLVWFVWTLTTLRRELVLVRRILASSHRKQSKMLQHPRSSPSKPILRAR